MAKKTQTRELKTRLSKGRTLLAALERTSVALEAEGLSLASTVDAFEARHCEWEKERAQLVEIASDQAESVRSLEVERAEARHRERKALGLSAIGGVALALVLRLCV